MRWGTASTVAVVVMLAALGYVAHGWVLRERDRYRQATCWGCVKELVLASLMYSHDFDDKLPPTRDWPSLIYPYLKDPAIYRCPDDARRSGTPYHEPGVPADLWLSYGANPGLAEAEVMKIPKHDMAMWIFDCDEMKATPGMAAWRHQGRANVAFADGRVMGLTQAEVASMLLAGKGPE